MYDEAFQSVLRPFFISGQTETTEDKRFAPWDDATEIASGQKFLKLYRQEIGDCVSHGMKNALEHLICIEIALLKEPERFHYCFPPWLYMISRMMNEGGRGQLGNSDGSLGSWMARTIRVHGVLRSDFPGVPAYSGSVAKQWGNSKEPKTQFGDEADNHLVKTVSQIKNGQQLWDALINGYMVTIASMWGANMRLKEEWGKHWYHGNDRWPHQMCYVAACSGDQAVCPTGGGHPPAAYRLNSWGANAHGGVQGDGYPDGGWITLDDADRDIRSSGAECFVFSAFDGYPSRIPDLHTW
jgi:hypothetical protein